MTRASSFSDSGAQEDPDTLVDPNYLSHFSKHVNDVRAHLSGSGDSNHLSPSFLAPSALWTSVEKDAFFHALAVHSRLRPDLIADEVQTKSVVDVCIYLHLLQRGTRNAVPILRKDFPISMEVSDAFVTLEEQKARSIIDAAPASEDRDLEAAREAEIELQEKAIRARPGEAPRESYERYEENLNARRRQLDEWLRERREEWEIEDILRTLDFPTLRAMDRILREEDEAQLQADQKAAASSEEGQHHAETATNRLPDDSIPEELSGSVPSATPHTITDDMIDPLLLAQSRDSGFHNTNFRRASYTPSSRLTEEAASSPRPAHSTSYDDTRQDTSLQTTYSSTGTIPVEQAVSVVGRTYYVPVNASGLSSAAKRKLMKRLYMRKRRAQAHSAAFSTAIKLRPGRKRSTKVLRRPDLCATILRGNTEEVASGGGDSDAELEAGSEWDCHARRSHLSGKTLPYKLLEKMREIGLDAEKLQDEYVGVMSLRGLARLMRLHNRLDDVEASVASEISSEGVKLLNAHVLHLIVELMHHVIVLREQEREAKKHTKGWRLGKLDHISQVHVEQALSLIGGENLDRKKHFTGLLTRSGLVEDDLDDKPAEQGGASSSSSEDEEDDEQDVDPGEDSDIGQDTEGAASFNPLNVPFHRVIIPPIVRLPDVEPVSSSVGAPPWSLSLSLYMPWPDESSTVPIEEDLLSETTNSDALMEEMLEDELIEERDLLQEEKYEESQWWELGGTPVAQQPMRSRKRKRAAKDGNDDPN